MKVGIHTVSSPVRKVILSRFLESGHEVYGYARESSHGKRFVETINNQGGIYLERPENKNKIPHMVSLRR